MKALSLAVLVLCLAAALLAAPARASGPVVGEGGLVAQGQVDFVEMYRQFFKNMVDRNYGEVWSSMTLASRQRVARNIADASAGKVAEDQVLVMLDSDENGVRTVFFDEFQKPVQKLLEGQGYVLKSSTADQAVVTITLDGEPKDFLLLREDGAFKINFFEDLFN